MKKIQCETKEVYRNKKNNMIYATKKDADHDINNPNTDTKEEDVVTDVTVIVPPEALNLVSDTKK
jgi:hypothetical protein|tara:strand:+ start:19 stop:213 length:195 start_codon:yes stop_codon:yes gene_type:complete